MRAAAYVTDSVNTYSQYSTGYRLFQRRYRDQTNSRGEAGPTYTTYLDLNKTAERWLQYNGYNFEAHEAL